MTLVTIHLAPGQTPQGLIREIQRLNGGGPVRTVSGRFGALVDAELAYRYLAEQYAPPAPAPEPPQAAEPAETVKTKPRSRPARKAAKAVTAAADNSEEV